MKMRIIAAGVVLAAFAAVVLFIVNRGQFLVLSDVKTEEVLFRAEAPEGTAFSVSFTHSVNKSPVSEHYIIKDGAVFLESLRYRAFGAGMPSEPDPGQTLRYEDGEMVIEGYDREMPYLVYFVGRQAGHVLHLEDEDIPLNEIAEPGDGVIFEIR
jgi:hypothetical protein